MGILLIQNATAPVTIQFMWENVGLLFQNGNTTKTLTNVNNLSSVVAPVSFQKVYFQRMPKFIVAFSQHFFLLKLEYVGVDNMFDSQEECEAYCVNGKDYYIYSIANPIHFSSGPFLLSLATFFLLMAF